MMTQRRHEPADLALDPGRSLAADGVVGDFHDLGVLGWAEVHTARTLSRLYGETRPEVGLALALTVRALAVGSVCLDLDAVRDTVTSVQDETVDVPEDWWPDQELWLEMLASSPMVALGTEATGDRPLRLIDHRLYLERYWADEESVRRGLTALGSAPLTPIHSSVNPFEEPGLDQQRRALRRVRESGLTVLAGGPGTGKTTTIAGILVALLTRKPDLRVALAAPTGKAAARMDEALQGARVALGAEAASLLSRLGATTVHRLLGWNPNSSTRFLHHADNPLPYDLIVVDETSMVSLTMMARLTEAVAPGARLVLVGDPDQLASVEAGAVLADLTQARWESVPTGNPVTTLTRNFRFGGTIDRLASAIRAGDSDAALDLLSSGGDVRLVPVEEPAAVHERVLAAGHALHEAARRRDASAALTALDRHRILCGHRRGPFGVATWLRLSEHWLREEVDGFGAEGEWYVGRPVLINDNDRDLDVFNGDSGVVLRIDGRAVVAIASRDGGAPRLLRPDALQGLQTVLAMTVHKAQGSQFEQVTLILPPEDSPLLTRELLYTAVTRAKHEVLLVGREASVRRAIGHPALRASGLRDRL